MILRNRTVGWKDNVKDERKDVAYRSTMNVRRLV